MIFELKQWWRILKTIILMVGVLLSFFVLVEVLHIFSIFKDVYLPLGYAFLLAIAAAILYAVLYLVAVIRKLPRVLQAPDIEGLEAAAPSECRAYAGYLTAYITRLQENPLLSAEDSQLASSKVKKLQGVLNKEHSTMDWLELISSAETEVVEPLLKHLDQKAEEEIGNSVRDIMIGVTLSPYRAADLFIVIYRNAAMVLRVMRIYNSRPLMKEQVLIFRDVLRVVATVNFMNFGQKLMDQLFSHVPYVGRALEDFAEGIGAGLLTSVAGHGALYRCRAYRGWNQEEAVRNLTSHVKRLLSDVKNIFKKDVLHRMRNRVYSTANPAETKDPGFWDKTMNGVSTALDATESVMVNMIKKPLTTGTRTTLKAGSSVLFYSRDAAAKGGRGIWKGVKFTGSKIKSGASAVGRLFKKKNIE
ncbi:YcjF family protein [Thermodesulfobacteriota bacterium]